MTVHERLVRARNEIAMKGWAQQRSGGGWYLAPDGKPRCTILALDPRCRAHLHDVEAVQALCSALDVRQYVEVARWNDEPERIVEDVLALYDKAIAATAPEPDLSKVIDPDLELAAALGDLA